MLCKVLYIAKSHWLIKVSWMTISVRKCSLFQAWIPFSMMKKCSRQEIFRYLATTARPPGLLHFGHLVCHQISLSNVIGIFPHKGYLVAKATEIVIQLILANEI